jgi:hypothetical protein
LASTCDIENNTGSPILQISSKDNKKPGSKSELFKNPSFLKTHFVSHLLAKIQK